MRVSGHVQGDSGQAMPGTVPCGWHTATRAWSMTAGSRTVRTEADGSFEIKNVTPGVYRLDAGGGADQLLTVTGADIEGIVLVSKTGSTVTGTLVADDGAPPSFPTSGVRILLDTWSDKVLPTVRVVSVDTDWSFKLGKISEARSCSASSAFLGNWMLAAVRFNGKDITDTPWDVPTGGREFKGLQVVVTQKVGQVAGTVLDSNGKPTAAASVVVFPEDPDLWMPGSRFVRTTRPDGEGRFSISSLPAGTYRAIARAFIEDGQWEEREFLEAARDEAVRFILAEGASETITLKLPASRQGK